MKMKEIDIADNIDGEGNCFVIHTHFMMENVKTKRDSKRYRICHGLVYHQLSDWHWHCWIEIDDKLCIDIANGLNVCRTKDWYYKTGHIKNVKRYTLKQMARNILHSGHYGEWAKEEDLFYDY